MSWRATILTIFPEMFPGPLGASLTGTALDSGRWELETVNIRDFALDRHRSVDDTPYGGGAGMVMRPDVVADAIDHALDHGAAGPRLYLSPRGRRLDQALARELADGPGVTLLCGRFEGIDQRVLDGREFEEVSVGDFVLSGGEIAAMVLLDAAIRLLPGVVGNDRSLSEESFEQGLLEYPHFTRPKVWEGRQVPDVLISGHHEKIRAWREHAALDITRRRRPDLLSNTVENTRPRAG
jgi:tRNA (guanine37-N1)-methyltransferase